MKTAQFKKGKLAKVLRFAAILPLCMALTYSTLDAVKALFAVSTLKSFTELIDAASNPQEMLKIRRSIQKHFLNSGVYVPMEDIVVASLNKENTSRLNFLMEKACGKGKLYIWVPIRFKWPIIGERVFDWCWKD